VTHSIALDLFATPLPKRAALSSDLDCYQTPAWACEGIIERYYGDLAASDMVLEPTCGEGHFLDAIPRHVAAVGVELDAARAAAARARTGREVIVGDICEIEIPFTPTAIIGNPPFRSSLVDRLLDRAHEWLPEGGRCGLVLPVMLLCRLPRVIRESERWSIACDLLPRDVFIRSKLALAFARFEKRRKRAMVGFALFQDAAAVRAMPTRARWILTHGRSPAWRAVVFDALRECGGEASLDRLYAAVEGRRPTANQHWRAKVRQVVQRYAVRSARGIYRLPCGEVAA
jgi:hypothetical protein